MQGKLEGLMARHWPEITSILPLTSLTLLKLLKHYGGLDMLFADKESTSSIRRFSCGRILAPEPSFVRPQGEASLQMLSVFLNSHHLTQVGQTGSRRPER